MKKIFVLLVIVLVSCSKQETFTDTELVHGSNGTEQNKEPIFYDKAYIEKAPLSEQLDYKRFHLMKIAVWLSKNDAAVYEVIANELGVNIDSDTFLVEDLVKEMISIDSSNMLNADDISFSLTAFENLDGEDAYPTIYLPDSDKYTNKAPYDSIKPIYAMDDYDEVNQEQIMVGYEEDSNNELQPIDKPFVPGIAEESEITVLSIGPCTGTDPIGQYRRVGCDTGGGGGGGNQNYERYYIRNMTIKSYKEIWPARSDISLVGFKTLGLPYENGACGYNISGASDCMNEPEGRFMKRFKRKWVKHQNEQTLNHLIDANDNTNHVDMYFALIIFERDGWPARKREETFSFPNGVVRTTNYRSWESKYHKVLVKNNSASQGVPKIDGYTQNNSDIKYNIGH